MSSMIEDPLSTCSSGSYDPQCVYHISLPSRRYVFACKTFEGYSGEVPSDRLKDFILMNFRTLKCLQVGLFLFLAEAGLKSYIRRPLQGSTLSQFKPAQSRTTRTRVDDRTCRNVSQDVPRQSETYQHSSWRTVALLISTFIITKPR